MFLPLAGTSCALPQLPQARYQHTVDNHILCGGEGNEKSCLKWSPDKGTWEELGGEYYLYGRKSHVSWTPGSGSGTYLIGGWDSPSGGRNSDLIKPDGTSEEGFDLKEEARLLTMNNIKQ